MRWWGSDSMSGGEMDGGRWSIAAALIAATAVVRDGGSEDGSSLPLWQHILLGQVMSLFVSDGRSRVCMHTERYIDGDSDRGRWRDIDIDIDKESMWEVVRTALTIICCWPSSTALSVYVALSWAADYPWMDHCCCLSSSWSSSTTLLTGPPLTAAVLELRLVGEMMPLLLVLLSASTVTGSVSVEIVR